MVYINGGLSVFSSINTAVHGELGWIPLLNSNRIFFSNTDLLSGDGSIKIMFLLRAMETIKCNKRDLTFLHENIEQNKIKSTFETECYSTYTINRSSRSAPTK